MQTPPSFNWSFLLLSFFFERRFVRNHAIKEKLFCCCCFDISDSSSVWHQRRFQPPHMPRNDPNLCNKSSPFETEPLSFIHWVTQCLAYRGIKKRRRRRGERLIFWRWIFCIILLFTALREWTWGWVELWYVYSERTHTGIRVVCVLAQQWKNLCSKAKRPGADFFISRITCSSIFEFSSSLILISFSWRRISEKPWTSRKDSILFSCALKSPSKCKVFL